MTDTVRITDGIDLIYSEHDNDETGRGWYFQDYDSEMVSCQSFVTKDSALSNYPSISWTTQFHFACGKPGGFGSPALTQENEMIQDIRWIESPGGEWILQAYDGHVWFSVPYVPAGHHDNPHYFNSTSTAEAPT